MDNEELWELEEKLHRTWVQVLLDHDYREIAAIAVDAAVSIDYQGTFDPQQLEVLIPTSAHGLVKRSDHIRKTMEQALRSVCGGHIRDQNGWPVDEIPITFGIKLIEIEEGWQNVIKKLIASAQDPNQGIVTDKAFSRKGQQPFVYNEMKFASKTEIRIAQEFESRGVLFFPLPLAVRADTGNLYTDHREVDFLVCQDGTWGILEVSYHPDRYEKDAEKDSWFKKSGILCIQHYSAERCYQTSSEVADEFLEILEKHRR